MCLNQCPVIGIDGSFVRPSGINKKNVLHQCFGFGRGFSFRSIGLFRVGVKRIFRGVRAPCSSWDRTPSGFPLISVWLNLPCLSGREGQAIGKEGEGFGDGDGDIFIRIFSRV